MVATGRATIFGRRKRPITIVVAQGETVRHVTLSGRSLILGTGVAGLLAGVAVFAFGALTPPTEVKEGVIGDHALRQSYETRIAVLRSQLDEATSRQIVAQKMVESKVDVLLSQQEEIAERYERLEPLLARARRTGILSESQTIPVPAPRPDASNPVLTETASQTDGDAFDMLNAFAGSQFAPAASSPFDTLELMTKPDAKSAPSAAITVVDPIQTASLRQSLDGGVDQALDHFGEAIDTAGFRQIADLRDLALEARERSSEIATVLAQVGIDVAADGQTGLGGPFEPAPETESTDPFDLYYAELEDALAELEAARTVSDILPLDAPMSSTLLSSRFGVRADPFLRRRALHSGIDYAAKSGTAITSTARGTVVAAGRSGGYGNMVEIDHGNGITTRYAHMSRIKVSVGDMVEKGEAVGRVGSTGRSTGPHLHYEIRRNDKAVDPMRFIRVGKRLKDLT